MIYILTLVFGFVIVYLLLYKVIFPIIFEKPLVKLSRRFFYSVIIIAVLSLANYFFITHFLDIGFGFGNRLLHAFGGGFVGSLVCFLVVKDGQIAINKFQFFIITALVVTALGVANEILEFILQLNFNYISASTVTDTWLDLSSNTVGLIVGGLLFTSFINAKIKK